VCVDVCVDVCGVCVVCEKKIKHGKTYCLRMCEWAWGEGGMKLTRAAPPPLTYPDVS
jgi:hypothetical protein